MSLSDDSWYRAPTFHPEVENISNKSAFSNIFQGTQSRRTDIEALCEIIYAYGERYDDGTAAIGFTWLFKVTQHLVTSKKVVTLLFADVQPG